MSTPAKGQLLLRVIDANGLGPEQESLWESNFQSGFVKVEVRGGSRTVKAQSTQKRVNNNSLQWDEQLSLNVLEGAKELRLMLCRERKSLSTGKISAVVMSACGIYVNEILENIPIDKNFDLFKPSTGTHGGSIHIQANFTLSDNSAENGDHAESPTGALTSQASGYVSDDIGSPVTPAAAPNRTRFADHLHEELEVPREHEEEGGRRKKGGFPKKLLFLAVLAGAAGFAAKQVANKPR